MTKRTWLRKFADAGRGVYRGITGQRSFLVHIPLAVAVVAAGIWFQVSLVEWCLLGLCITLVTSAEIMNSSIESLAQAVTQDHDDRVRDALDIASGAVLIAALGAAAVGGAIFLARLFS